MKSPVLVLGGSDYEYYVCDTVDEVLSALRAECKKFVSDSRWSSDTETVFATTEDAANHLFGFCLTNGNFGDICSIVKLQENTSMDGELELSIWD